MKATASTYSHPKPVCRVDQQTVSSRITSRPRSTFIGERISNHQLHKGRTAAPDDGKCIEDAFWKRKPLHGRQITSVGVLKAYRNDCTSLRSGFFLQKLCLQNILHGNRKITPDQVMREFNREPNRTNMQKLAITRFKAECCLRGLLLNGRRVTPDAVVKGYQSATATLELARFKQECCLRRLSLNGREVTPDKVLGDFPDSPEGRLGMARFKAECCLRGLLLNGQRVTPDEVIEDFPDSPQGRLGIARFKQECCLRGLLLNGQQVTPDSVAKDYQAVNATLELSRFKAECCLRGLRLNGQLVTPDSVVKEYERCDWLYDRDFFLCSFAIECETSVRKAGVRSLILKEKLIREMP
ncbi:hypothetical protein [Endozoicomonas sp. SESOKO1]|uniref:hypothetical protein n=1 Tax=Endozoicomonas sp. SESOKO1 TaxID=2828742 RepID=UPI0021496D8C|nr:hypothetical protein [Endozoicomonas sp. SESOKO1]